jgi:ATP-dependent Clp protease ATP-binding subunit ClpC
VFQRFTDRARRVVVLAQEEARTLRHNYVGTEHVLLGLVREGDGVAARALESMGITLEDVRRQVEELIGKGQAAPTGHIPFTPRAKKVLELALREALELGHNYIGTEHVLLGLIREGESEAAQVLEALGATMDRVRQAVMGVVSGHAEGQAAAAGGTAETTAVMSEVVPEDVSAPAESFPSCPTCRSSLADTLAVRTLELKNGSDTTMVKMAYCSRCGTALGTIP